MGIFSRGKRSRDDAAAPAEDRATAPDQAAPDAATPDQPEDTAAQAAADQAADQTAGPATQDAAADTEQPGEAVPQVGISVSTYGKPPAAPPAAQPATPAAPRPRSQAPELPPAPTETLPGLRDNALVAKTLANLPDSPDGVDLMNVARQLLQGHLFLRVQGDARSLIAEGKNLPLAVATINDKRFALAYSNGAALQASVRADGDTSTSAMGQPVLAVIRHVLSAKYDGLILDHASAPARAVLPTALLTKMVETFDEQLTIKTLLAGERTPETAARVAEALTHAPLWVAVNRAGEDGPIGVAESRQADGSRYLEVYSHPLEVVAGGRGDQAAPITAAQLAKSLFSDERLTGIVVDPRGPWLRLRRDDLAPLLALTD